MLCAILVQTITEIESADVLSVNVPIFINFIFDTFTTYFVFLSNRYLCKVPALTLVGVDINKFLLTNS